VSAMERWTLDERGAGGAIAGVVRPIGGGEPCATMLAAPVLREGFSIDDAGAARVAIAWTGAPGLGAGDDAFAREPRAWLPGAAEALGAALDALAPALALGGRGHELWLRPHARHVLGDHHRVGSFLDGRDDGDRIGLLLDPAAMLDVGMEADALGHVERALEALAGRARAVVAANARPAGDDRLAPAALHDGLMDPRELAGLYRGLVPAGTPIVLVGGEAGRQAGAIGAGPGAGGG
jgi:hypothetical protein